MKKKRGETGTYKRRHVKNNTTHLPEKKRAVRLTGAFNVAQSENKEKATIHTLKSTSKEKKSRFCGLNSVFTI